MANEKINAAGTLWRVTYTHVTDAGHIRAGGIALQASNAEEAKKIADARLTSFGLKHYRITSAKEY